MTQTIAFGRSTLEGILSLQQNNIYYGEGQHQDGNLRRDFTVINGHTLSTVTDLDEGSLEITVANITIKTDASGTFEIKYHDSGESYDSTAGEWNLLFSSANAFQHAAKRIIKDLYLEVEPSQKHFLKLIQSIAVLQSKNRYLGTLQYRLFHRLGAVEQLLPKLHSIGLNWSNYSKDGNNTMDVLEEEGLVIRFSPKYHNEIDTDSNVGLAAVGHVLDLEKHQTLILSNYIFPTDMNMAHAFKKKAVLHLEQKGDETVGSALLEAFDTLSPSDVYVGYRFNGKIVRLVDVIRAIEIDAHLPPSFVEVDLYTDTSKIIEQGAYVIVSGVPSIVGTDQYSFRINHMPINGMASARDLTWMVDSNHLCKKSQYDFTYSEREGFGLNGDLLDHHTILGFRRASKLIEETTQAKVLSPFITTINEETRDFFYKCLRQVLIEENKSGIFRRRPMRLLEMEVLLWKYKAVRNYG